MSDRIQTERWLLELRDDDKIEVMGFGEGVYVLTVDEVIELRNALVAITKKYTLTKLEALILNDAGHNGGVAMSYFEQGLGTGMSDDLVNSLFGRGLLTGDKDGRLYITDAGRVALASYQALRA